MRQLIATNWPGATSRSSVTTLSAKDLIMTRPSDAHASAQVHQPTRKNLRCLLSTRLLLNFENWSPNGSAIWNATFTHGRVPEHYLLRYLRALHQRASSVATPNELEEDMRALLRFYVDVIDEGSVADKIYKEILEAHRYALRRIETAER